MHRFDIETARLRLRPITLGGLDDMWRIWNEPGVRKFLWDDQPVSREMAEDAVRRASESFEQHGFGIWAITHKENAAVIGFCGFRRLAGGENADGENIEVLYGM